MKIDDHSLININYDQIKENWIANSFENKKKQINVKVLYQNMGKSILSCLVGHQIIYMLPGLQRRPQSSILGRIKMNYYYISNNVRYSSSIFIFKILIDAISQVKDVSLTEYRKGGVAGFLAFTLNRPFEQITKMQQITKILDGRDISLLNSARTIIQSDGIKGLYKYQNILGFTNSFIYRSVYFGFYSRLNNSYRSDINTYLFFPFCASTAASLSTLIFDKIRNLSLQQHFKREKLIQKIRGNEEFVQEPVSMVVTKKLLEEGIKFNKFELQQIGLSIFKSGLLLALFALSQTKDDLTN